MPHLATLGTSNMPCASRLTGLRSDQSKAPRLPTAVCRPCSCRSWRCVIDQEGGSNTRVSGGKQARTRWPGLQCGRCQRSTSAPRLLTPELCNGRGAQDRLRGDRALTGLLPVVTRGYLLSLFLINNS